MKLAQKSTREIKMCFLSPIKRKKILKFWFLSIIFCTTLPPFSRLNNKKNIQYVTTRYSTYKLCIKRKPAWTRLNREVAKAKMWVILQTGRALYGCFINILASGDRFSTKVQRIFFVQGGLLDLTGRSYVFLIDGLLAR